MRPGGSNPSRSAMDYAAPGPLTDLGAVPPAALDGLPDDALGICRCVRRLFVAPLVAAALGVDADRLAARNIRPAGALAGALLALDPAPLHEPRPRARRVVGTCRHFAVMSCALLRHRGITARARCGFATYFDADRGLDHWITEYRDEDDGRWVRIDSEHLGRPVLADTEDLPPGAFLTGGEAWSQFRAGRLDAQQFGVLGTENWGPAEIRGNVIRDLAALNKVEMLPWDEWGRMETSYQGTTGPEYDELIDRVAAACAAADPSAATALYAVSELRVPDTLVA